VSCLRYTINKMMGLNPNLDKPKFGLKMQFTVKKKKKKSLHD